MTPETPRARRRPSKKAYLLITLAAFLMVLLPFLFWYATWFGRRLTDEQIDQYFADRATPRHAQHALVQIGERMSMHQNVSRWYPQVVAQASSPMLELRQTAAWIMGREHSYPPFHEALLRLLNDSEPMVRRNAALARASYGDPAGRPELLQMLRPFTITAPEAGSVRYRLKPGDYVNPGTMVAHIGDKEVRSAVPGEVRSLDRPEGSRIEQGQPLADLQPDKNHVWEALRGLYLVGQAPDLEDVERYLRPVAGMPDTIERQASATAEAIKSRRPTL